MDPSRSGLDDPPSAFRGRRSVAEIAGQRLELAVYGKDDEPPGIVLLHEGLGSVSMWRDFPERVAERTGLGVLAYSRRGYGASEPLREPRRVDYMHEEAEVVLPAVLDHFRTDRPVLVGHSDGASIALLYAGRADARAGGLFLLAPHVFVEELGLRGIEAARVAYEKTDLRERLARHHDDVDGAFRGWNDVWRSAPFREWNIEEVLRHVRCPVLVIQGTDDPYGTMEQVHRIARQAPHVELLKLEGCGHAPHRERPEEVLDALAELTRRMSFPRGGGYQP